MMTSTKKSKKSKKSTTKKREYKISPLIPIIALIEVLVLIAVSSYAWYFVSASKIIGSGTISVAADSGLDIDFQYSNVDDYINIWNYVGSDFTFEPATSMDGRMIYFPTSGTFDKTNTRDLVLRDGTVNDINSKYLSIDFELTNTSDYDQYVYLNNKSYFQVLNKNDDRQREESRALRLAFYSNDGNSGNVGSSLLTASGASDGDAGQAAAEGSAPFTIYFDNSSANWQNPYAYFYDSNDRASYPNEAEYESAWPGVKMDRVSGSTYKVTIENPTTSTGVKYDKLILSNFGNNQTGKFSLTGASNGHKFNTSSDVGGYSSNTIYFVKPDSWGDTVKAYAWKTSSNTPYTPGNGDDMSYVGAGIYAYTYDSANTGGILFNNGSMGGTNQTADISITPSSNGNLYYCTGTQSSGKYAVSTYSKKYTASDFAFKTVYLYNTYSWEKPYAVVTVGNNESTQAKAYIAMTSLSGNVYYCKVPEIYTYGFFRQKELNNNPTNRSKHEQMVNQTVYRPIDTLTTGDNYRDTKTFLYADYIQSTGYPVISPGVSAGFQRPYSPVLEIDAYTGEATKIIPAYSNSIDNYILGSGTPLFVLKSGHMVSLSMIMWLEGTDEACYGNTYPGNWIDLRLEFSTEYYPDGDDHDPVIVNPGDSNSYVYKFYDKTREIWTSDRQPTESGVTVAPVMQLYDNTIKRGYLMQPVAYASYGGKQKVSCWAVSAPQSIVNLGHDIIFRRVNPYNEDEVWNYWHAGRAAGGDNDPAYRDLKEQQEANAQNYTAYDIAFSGGNTISFTAFADGSPLKTMSGLSTDTDSTYKVPDLSCGGLWGNHSVRTVTVYDGLINQPLKDNNGVLTVNYSYPYKVSSTTKRTVKIEYKASGPELNSFYYVIMPEVAYANNVYCSFKRYTGFDSGYAINSAEKNPNITFVNYYGKGQRVSGDYFELSVKTDGTDYSYWGSDMLYVQTGPDSKNYVYTSSSANDNNAKLFQVFFTANSDFNNRSSNSRFSYLHYNGNLNPQGTGDGYACVVPNDRDYLKLRLENCNYNGTTQYNVTDPVTILGASNVPFSDPYTGASYNMKVRYLEQNGITASYIGITLYLQTTHQSSGNDPHCHIFNDDSNNNSPDNWPGYMMNWEADINNYNLKKFYVCDGNRQKIVINVSKYPKVIFAYYGGSSQSQTVTLDMNTVKNDMIYESNGGDGQVGRVDSSTNNVTLRFSNDWTAADWPHLTFQNNN